MTNVILALLESQLFYLFISAKNYGCLKLVSTLHVSCNVFVRHNPCMCVFPGFQSAYVYLSESLCTRLCIFKLES